MKKVLLFLITILSFNCYSQISFEKGYYIDNLNHKINCLINIDWKNNPTKFEFKLSENSEPKTGTIKLIKEFGIHNVLKYSKNTVNIDRSSNDVNKLSDSRKPKFNKEEHFLKVLVEGKSNLYEYADGNLIRYFYSKENLNIEQLIFKKYKTIENKLAENKRFRQQLWVDLKCPNFKRSRIQSLDYKKKDLVQFFTDYSKCHNNSVINFKSKEKRDLFNLTIRPRLNNSSLTMYNTVSTSRNVDLGSEIGFGIGVEAEFILPFNKNKWAIAVEPTYQNFKSVKRTNRKDILGGVLITDINYTSVEIPVSLRHYLFLNKTSKLFVNASFIFDLSSKSSIKFRRDNGSDRGALEIKTRNNLAMGIGYKQNDKYSLEIRYQAAREILSDYIYWNSEYKSLSIIFGYSFF